MECVLNVIHGFLVLGELVDGEVAEPVLVLPHFLHLLQVKFFRAGAVPSVVNRNLVPLQVQR